MAVYFEILMFFSAIQDRWNSYLHVTANFNVQVFFDLRKYSMTIWKSKFSIIFNQYFAVYKKKKKGKKEMKQCKNVFLKI